MNSFLMRVMTAFVVVSCVSMLSSCSAGTTNDQTGTPTISATPNSSCASLGSSNSCQITLNYNTYGTTNLIIGSYCQGSSGSGSCLSSVFQFDLSTCTQPPAINGNTPCTIPVSYKATGVSVNEIVYFTLMYSGTATVAATSGPVTLSGN